jgi:hypothetical protein
MKTGRFFTEGTNLFNIGNIFLLEELVEHQHLPNVTDEEVTNYTSSVDLINVL